MRMMRTRASSVSYAAGMALPRRKREKRNILFLTNNHRTKQNQFSLYLTLFEVCRTFVVSVERRTSTKREQNQVCLVYAEQEGRKACLAGLTREQRSLTY